MHNYNTTLLAFNLADAPIAIGYTYIRRLCITISFWYENVSELMVPLNTSGQSEMRYVEFDVVGF